MAGTVSLKVGAEITIVLVARVQELAVLVLPVLSKVLAIAEVNGGSVSEDGSRKSAGGSTKCSVVVIVEVARVVLLQPSGGGREGRRGLGRATTYLLSSPLKHQPRQACPCQVKLASERASRQAQCQAALLGLHQGQPAQQLD